MISDDDRVSRAACDHEHTQAELLLISTAQSKSKTYAYLNHDGTNNMRWFLMNFVNFSEFIKSDLGFHSDPRSTDCVSLISIATF